ncbi:ATP-binding protein [Maridesulfovibrio bastinii]|uniref:ATP-binding protein n=1 Tax=Maridesulfovibrio bastinii TaxID=47157 RepID=UPI00042A7FAD|nr:4Fe-4S binding protein [Maridesulfovibrio bastinii]
MKVSRKLITIDEELCNGCGQCVPGCAEGALQIIDGKARLVAEKFCDGLGACLGECPTGALTVREVEADDFDPEAVKQLLKEQGREVPEHMPDPESLRTKQRAGGCPSAKIEKLSPCAAANEPVEQGTGPSRLSHWPVQLRLVPAEAPFLKGADLLLTADCVAVAMPGYHERFLPGRTVLMGCPKFDDVELYVEKLSAIFAGCGLKSVTVLEMEVPCCSGMSRIVAAAMKNAASDIPVEKIVVAKTGEIKSRGPLAQPLF